MLIKIDHLNISVKNLEQSASFYENLFGLKTEESGLSMDGITPYKIIGLNDFHLCMYEKPNLSQADIDKSPVDHFGIRIDRPEAFLQTCERIGVRFNYGGEIHHKSSSSWYITDPSGYEIEVSYAEKGAIGFK
jgi:catechol 2,3-dioxygenase-like lactoylglutathione lyase family enzyme